MDLLVSGYGAQGWPSIAKYHVEGAQVHLLWKGDSPAPSYLCRAGDSLIAVSEREDGGELLLWEQDKEGLRLADRAFLNGTLLCQLTYSPKHGKIYCAAYGNGQIAAVSLDGGRFGPVYTEFVLPGSRAGETRAHCCTLSPAEKWLYAVNIAQDRIDCYLAETLEVNRDFPTLCLPDGEGPRHLKFLPGTNFAYLITEYSNRVHVLHCHPGTGALSLIQSVSSLPDAFSGESYGATVAFSPEGRMLYAANRGADTVAAFPIRSDGTLAEGREYPSGTNPPPQSWPRDITITQDGKYLLCANQRGNEVAVFPVLPNGGLALPSVVIPFAAPSCVLDISTP